MQDKIILKDMSFYGYHGVLDEENTLGQRFIIDLEVGIDLKPAGLSDDLEQTISYVELYKATEEIMTGKPFKLIEALAEKIAQHILDHYQLAQWIRISINKPNAPVPSSSGLFAIEIYRQRAK